MTYLESAYDIRISHHRAMLELKRHGHTSEESITEFHAGLGLRRDYLAQDVLAWLGY